VTAAAPSASFSTSSRRVPAYRLHRPTGQAVVTLAGRDHYLGHFGTPPSQEKYARLVAEWVGAGRSAAAARTPPAHAAPALSVNELILAYLDHCDHYYGTAPKEREKIRLSLRPLVALYGPTPAAEFGPLALRAVRSDMETSLARTAVNMRVGVIKRLFKWAAGHELAPPHLPDGLRAVEGLRRGRSKAREPEPVRDGRPHLPVPAQRRHRSGEGPGLRPAPGGTRPARGRVQPDRQPRASREGRGEGPPPSRRRGYASADGRQLEGACPPLPWTRRRSGDRPTQGPGGHSRQFTPSRRAGTVRVGGAVEVLAGRLTLWHSARFGPDPPRGIRFSALPAPVGSPAGFRTDAH
jgi:hypothetical protein